MIFRLLAAIGSCLAIITLIQGAQGYPTGAPPEGCRTMLPGHGVPAQTGTTNPYTITTDKTNFSCPGDEIKVTVSGDIFRGFLCEPIPNTGTFVQDIRDPVRKQNKCAQMTSLTHVDNVIKSRISFLWKPETIQTVIISCTVVQSKNYFWVNMTSPVLKYVKTHCNKAAGQQEPPEHAEIAPPSEITNSVENTGSRSDTAEIGGSKDVITDPETTGLNTGPEKGGKSKDTITSNKPEKGGKSKDTITDADKLDPKDADGNGLRHGFSGVTYLVLCVVVCVMYL